MPKKKYNLIELFLTGRVVKKRAMGMTYTYEVLYVPPHLVTQYIKEKENKK